MFKINPRLFLAISFLFVKRFKFCKMCPLSWRGAFVISYKAKNRKKFWFRLGPPLPSFVDVYLVGKGRPRQNQNFSIFGFIWDHKCRPSTKRAHFTEFKSLHKQKTYSQKTIGDSFWTPCKWVWRIFTKILYVTLK